MFWFFFTTLVSFQTFPVSLASNCFFFKIASIIWKSLIARVQKPRLGVRFFAPSYRKNDLKIKFFDFFTTLVSFQTFPVSLAPNCFFWKIARIIWKSVIARDQKLRLKHLCGVATGNNELLQIRRFRWFLVCFRRFLAYFSNFLQHLTFFSPFRQFALISGVFWWIFAYLAALGVL